MSGRRTCPVGECQRRIQTGHLMCFEHWRRVPRDLKAEVNDSWKVYRRMLFNGDRSPAAIDAAARYRVASEQAVKHAAEALP